MRPSVHDGERDWRLELKLGDLESALARMWPMANADFLDLGDAGTRKSLALFLAVIWLRHPDNLALAARLHGALVGMFDSAPKDPAGNPHVTAVIKGEETTDRHIRLGSDTGSLIVTIITDSLPKRIERDAIHLAEILLSKRWSVIFAEHPIFITSDKPITKAHQTLERFGFGTKGTLVSFPLSPTRVLFMDDNHGEPGNQYYPLNAGDPAALNFTAMRNAANFIISPRPTDDVLREIVSLADGWERDEEAGD